MSDTTFVDGTTPVPAAWFNDVNIAIYRALGAAGVAPTTATQVLNNLGIPAPGSYGKSANYTIVTADNGKIFDLSGGFFTMTLASPAGYPAAFKVVLVNKDTTRGKSMQIAGYSNFILWPGQNITVYNDNNTWVITPYPQRWVTANAPTFYVDNVNGNNLNDGLAAGTGNAFATVQYAVSVCQNNLDFQGAGHSIIQLTSGQTITEQVIVYGDLVANTEIYIQGDTSGTPANWGNFIWQVPASGIGISAKDGGYVTVQGIKMTSGGSGATGLLASQFGLIDFQHIDFSTFTGGTHWQCNQLGILNMIGPYQVSGNVTNHGACTVLGMVNYGPTTVTLPNALTVAGDFFAITGGQISMAGVTFSGAGSGAGTTGQQYNVNVGALFKGANTIPGNSAGTTSNGGVAV